MKKGTKLAVVIISFLIIGMSLPTIAAENTGGESGPEFQVILKPAFGNCFSYDVFKISVKNVGDATAHNVTLIDLIIDGKVLYNNRVTEWEKSIEPGETIHDSPDSTFIGFGIFTATMTVTCDEGVDGTGSGNGFILGPMLFIP
jgi:hypothetical protein